MPFYQLPSGASPVLAGTAPPTGGIGTDGDLFIDRTNKFLYGPKASGSWPTGIDLSNGPTGVTGSVGATGPAVTGPSGPTGGIAFSVGPTAPTAPALTIAGAVWLDQNTGRYFVRYLSQFIEVGVQGERGPTGVTGSVGSTGSTGPSGLASTVTGPAGSFSTAQEINNLATGYTLALSDAGKLLTFNSTGTINVVIPAIATVSFATGTHIDLVRLNTGTVSVTGASGVTVDGTPGTSLRERFSSATCIHYTGNKWVVVGDLS